MPHPRRVLRLILLVALAVALVACSRRSSGGGGGGDTDASRPDAAFPDGSRLDGGGTDAGPRTDAGPLPEDVLIYAHSRDTLYTFSPDTLTVTEVGRFELPDGTQAPYMLDLAVDAEGSVYTSSDTSLYVVDPETAGVTEVGDFGLTDEQLFALSFLAEGELRAGETPLVGATNAGAYYEIDVDTAEATYLGSYPDGWLSSGDIVSVADLGTFATVKRDDFPSDVLVQILFAADGSSTVSVRGPIKSATEDFQQLFGLGYWGRKMYGFDNAGQLLEIDRDTGAAELVTADTGTEHFWGAGVTTRAPVLF